MNVVGQCQSGCEIWIPAVSVPRGKDQQIVLQRFLDRQPAPKKVRA